MANLLTHMTSIQGEKLEVVILAGPDVFHLSTTTGQDFSDITPFEFVTAGRISKCFGESSEMILFLFKGIFDKEVLTTVMGDRIFMFELLVESHCGFEEELAFE